MLDRTLWFRYEGVIIHICCRDLISAQKLFDVARNIGFKRGGIQSTSNKIMLELQSTEFMESLIGKNGKLLVSEEYIKELIYFANLKMQISHDKINTLNNLFLKSDL